MLIERFSCTLMYHVLYSCIKCYTKCIKMLMEAVQEYITCRINEYVYTSFLLLYSLLLFKSDSIVMVKILLFCVNLAQDGFSLFGLFTGLCHSHMVYGYRINGFASGHVPLLGNARAALTIRNPRKVVQFQTLKGFDKSHYMGTMATQSASDENHKLLADVTSMPFIAEKNHFQIRKT